jgi:uncharacterized membrane protein YgdD (TMEM256/DUF423 family)
MTRRYTAIGAGLAFLAVALGAFGAHALKDRLSSYSMGVYQTGVQYHLAHALALLLVAALADRLNPALVRWSGNLMAAGIFIFSGSLYLLALTGMRWLGAITPLGGVCFLAAWALLCAAALRAPGEAR